MNFYQEFVDELNRQEVRFLIFGGFAVNYYGYNRFTADLDVWIDPDQENLNNFKKALINLDFENSSNMMDFTSQKLIMLRLADGNLKIDLLQKINLKKSFQQCYKDSVLAESSLGKVRFISYPDLIEEKLLSKRPKDFYDIQQLKIIRKE